MPNPHTFTGDPEIPILSKTAVFFDGISFGFDDISFSVSKI